MSKGGMEICHPVGTPFGKGEATCHSSPWYMVLYTEDVWKATTRVPCSHMTRMVENTLLVAEGICTTIFY